MLLRVLIVIGTKNDDAAVLPWQEVRLIESAIHNFKRDAAENQLAHRIIDIEVLAQPDLERLQKKYQEIKPHIFHFIGHGGLNDDGDAYLLLKYPDKTQPDKFEETEWTYDFISTTFRNFESVPRFVFINACRSENKRLSEEEIKTQAWSIGDVFRDLKVPAVLTMQADIGSESAGIFSGAIYESLARLEPLDAALAHAREAMLNNLATTKKRDWAIPVLTVAAPSEEILPFKPKASKELMAKIKSCEAFAGIECFIDRTEPRRQLIQGFYPLPPGVPDKHLTIVKGEENSGKTWLAKWCLEVCALLNHDVRYVEVGGERTTTWLDVLLRIRGGDKINRGSLLIHQELDKTAFEQFYWELQHRFQMSEPPPRNNSPVVPKDDYQLAGSTWTPKFYTDTIESFLQALAQTAHADNPLIIVLNRFKGISESDMKNELIPKLFEPVAAGQVRSVKFVLVLTEDEYRNFDVANLVSRSNKVSVNLLKPDTFFDVASEYLRKLNRLQNLGFLEEEIADLAKNTARLFVKKNQDYSPSELERRFG